MNFISPTAGKVTMDQVTQLIERYTEEDPKGKYRIVIGTDSQTSRKATQFVTAIIIHRVGKGARIFYRKVKHKPIHELRHRIYKETEMSLELMELLKEEGFSALLEKWPIEIHLDVGKQGETRKVIQEVVGWVTSVGYIARIKPDSYGASSVADRYTKSIS
ncbi:ribonuclease H-like YkuK family protein [Guptibacillus hwajinpoensis]|uniref:DUF458 domain-containing protein n=2 Tax=Guptibacillus hwajinpoensis TaxID=208199 RepID=A0A0J6D0V3_9BACL|nr:ribonuclease H-like YkuK family protein [Alkalihalobacillus macyae]KMM38975.1 hypothetical protein AB986_06945 [Alkalihalobacillus macyae]